MFGISKQTNGFTLIELLIVMAIIGIMAISIPRFVSKRSTTQAFVERLNLLAQKTYNNASTTGTLHRIVINLENNEIYAEQERPNKKFQPLSSQHQTSLPIAQTIEFENISIDGTDELALGDPKKVWFFIVPNGLAQEVSLSLQGTDAQGATSITRYKLNPFSVQFEQIT